MQQNRRLLLFDIDGTLVNWAGASAGVFRDALTDAVGREVDTQSYSFAGRTDPEIAMALLRRAGVPEHELQSRVQATLTSYVERLSELVPVDGPAPQLLPGVRDLLAMLARIEPATLGLLTGNIEAGARIKLEHFDLWRYFPVGAFGSDDSDRNALVPVAVERARRSFGHTFPKHHVVVIGDTPRDVACAIEHDATSIGVATGSYSADALREAGAHVVLDDFAHTGRVVDVLMNGASPVSRGEAKR